MNDDPQGPAPFQSETQTTNSRFGYVAAPFVVATATFFVSLSKLHNGSDGGLNGLNGIFAGFFALLAFVATLVAVLVIRAVSR